MASDLFYKQIHLITGKTLNLHPADPLINISRKYYPLFDNNQKGQISIGTVADIVHSILQEKKSIEIQILINLGALITINPFWSKTD